MLESISAAPGRAESGRLSPRETQVLEMVALGLTNMEIATRLHVSIHAIKFHLAAIYRKLGVANRTEAAVAFLNGRARTVTEQPEGAA
jgi:LuxR family maltose regulon positive regulatory protein